MTRPGWDWHHLKGDLSGHWSVSVNDNWRLTIAFVYGDASWMICIIMLARGPFVEGRLHAWNTIAIPLASWFLIDNSVFNRQWRLGQCASQYGNGDDVRYPSALFAPALQSQALIT